MAEREHDTLQDFFKDVVLSLKRWESLHFDKTSWAAEWIGGESPESFLNSLIGDSDGVIKNTYFEFDLLEATSARLVGSFVECDNCGFIYEKQWEHCECEIYDDDGEEVKDAEHTFSETSTDALRDHLRETGVTSCTEEIIYAMENEGYDTYYEALGSRINVVKDRIDRFIDNLENAEDHDDIITYCLAACHLTHLHGNILEDYGSGFSGSNMHNVA